MCRLKQKVVHLHRNNEKRERAEEKWVMVKKNKNTTITTTWEDVNLIQQGAKIFKPPLMCQTVWDRRPPVQSRPACFPSWM